MLSVGRELKIHDRQTVCQACAWEGAGAELATGLAPVMGSAFYIYPYRCPACGSFQLSRQGKLLGFRLRRAARQSQEETGPVMSDQAISSQRRKGTLS